MRIDWVLSSGSVKGQVVEEVSEVIREGVKSCILGRILEHCSPPLLSLVYSTPPTPFDARPGGSGLDSAVINGGGGQFLYIFV